MFVVTVVGVSASLILLVVLMTRVPSEPFGRMRWRSLVILSMTGMTSPGMCLALANQAIADQAIAEVEEAYHEIEVLEQMVAQQESGAKATGISSEPHMCQPGTLTAVKAGEIVTVTYTPPDTKEPIRWQNR